MTGRDRALEQFIAAAGWDRAGRATVAGDASKRRYERLTAPDGRTAIVMDAPPDTGEDIRPFIRIADHLNRLGLSAPRVLHSDVATGFVLLEDLGDALFARLLAESAIEETSLYAAATDLLCALQRGEALPLSICNSDWLVDMTSPVFDWYLCEEAQESFNRFKAIFRPLADRVDAGAKVVALRDYHAENLIWLPRRDGVARVGLLDFQDAMLAHPGYDLVSVLQDARRDVPLDVEVEMIDRFVQASGHDPHRFKRDYAVLGVQRNLRILGIFARLCLRDGKARYLDFMPRVWGLIHRNLAHPDLAQLAEFVNETLPEPKPEFLQGLRNRCPTPPVP